MNIVYVTASLATGEIVAVSNSEPLQVNEGFAVLPKVIPDGSHFVPDHLTQKVDWDADEIVDMLPWESAAARMPKLDEVRSDIARELAATDQYTVPDRPMSEVVRSAWLSYRQALRDLSKVDPARGRVRTVPEMISEWPARPDGSDAAARLRARIEG